MKLTNKTRFLSAGALLAVLTASLYATMHIDLFECSQNAVSHIYSKMGGRSR